MVRKGRGLTGRDVRSNGKWFGQETRLAVSSSLPTLCLLAAQLYFRWSHFRHALAQESQHVPVSASMVAILLYFRSNEDLNSPLVPSADTLPAPSGAPEPFRSTPFVSKRQAGRILSSAFRHRPRPR